VAHMPDKKEKQRRPAAAHGRRFVLLIRSDALIGPFGGPFFMVRHQTWHFLSPGSAHLSRITRLQPGMKFQCDAVVAVTLAVGRARRVDMPPGGHR